MNKERTEQEADWPEKVSAKIALAVEDLLTTPEKTRNRREYITEAALLTSGLGIYVVRNYSAISAMIGERFKPSPPKETVIGKGGVICAANLCFYPYSGISKLVLSTENLKKVYEQAPFPLDKERYHIFTFGLETEAEATKKALPNMPLYIKDAKNHYLMLNNPGDNVENTSLAMNIHCLMVLRGYQKYGDSYWQKVREKTNVSEFAAWQLEIDRILVTKKLPLMIKILEAEKPQATSL